MGRRSVWVAAVLLLLAGCSDGDADRPAGEAAARVVDCGLTAEMHGAAHPYAQLRVTNAGSGRDRFRVEVRFLAGGEVLGEGEAETPEIDPGGAVTVVATMAGGAERVDRCEVRSAERA